MPAKVLSVDDAPANLLAMRAVLEPLGFAITDAGSGPEALELALRDEFAVILLDMMMPTMDGLETLARLRETAQIAHTPVVLVTAGDMNDSIIERAYALGAVDYIAKPFNPQILRAKVKTLAAIYLINQELRSKQAELARKDRYIAVLAHDLRNPLHTVSGGLRLLLRSDLSARSRGLGERISRAIDRMDRMITDLLDHARAGAGTIPLARSSADLGVLSREMVEEFETADPNRQIELTLEGDLRGQWDVARMYQALSNLVGNATHYGRGLAALTIDGRGEEVRISVFNDGPPISAELLPQLFQPFRRGPDNGPGLGLGLYIVDAIVQAHGGTVSVDSTRERGTTFLLRIPRGEPVLTSVGDTTSPP